MSDSTRTADPAGDANMETATQRQPPDEQATRSPNCPDEADSAVRKGRRVIHPPMLPPPDEEDDPERAPDRLPADDGTTFGEVMRLYAIVSEVLQFFMDRFGILGLVLVLGMLVATTVWTAYNYLSGTPES